MIAFAMVLLLLVANVVAMQYGHGAVRAAVDEAARVGALLGNAEADCRERAEDMLRGDGGLLRGPIGDSVELTCASDGVVMQATATGTFDWWVGGFPAVSFRLEAQAPLETPP
jgi:hypothetical protein